MRSRRIPKIAIASFTFLVWWAVLGVARPAAALTFNRNLILSDRDMTDAASLTARQVQLFFERISSPLRSSADFVNGVSKTAADIITESAVTHRISPKVLIVVLQKEQSLVLDPTPSQRQFDWATGFGVCDSCSTDDPAIQQFRGFANQIDWAAKQNRKYIDASGNYAFQPGRESNVDGVAVTPANQATANLYNYTPHLHGNELFWNYWTRWFTIKYPDGSLLRAHGEQGVWLIRDGKKNPFISRSAFVSQYVYRKVIDVDRDELQVYETGTPIKFPNDSLLQAPSGGVFLLSDGTKRPIVSREAFRRLGYNPEELIPVTWEDVRAYPVGDPITEDTLFPSGILLQSRQTGGVYFIQNGVRRAIHSREIYASQFGGRRPIPADDEDILQYPKGEDMPFRDGEIITAPGTRSVYVISNGMRRPIPSGDVFRELGLRWENLIRTTDRALAVHPEGEPLDTVTPQ